MAHHPDKPYHDRRVNKQIADGREFLRNSLKSYDLIIFALPDSIIRLSPMSNVRLESYLFTIESFEDVKKHLKPNGNFIMYNQYPWPWLKVRLATMLRCVFGQEPWQKEVGLFTVFAAGKKPKESSDYNMPAGDFGHHLPTDDWPFFYMQKPGTPFLYMGMIGMFLFSAILGVWFFAPKGTLSKPDLPFFFMGAAFLLLETKSISLLSLLFGATWMVNSLAFAGVLVSVLMANVCVHLYNKINRRFIFGLLFGVLTLAYLCPPSLLLNIGSPVIRYAVVIAFIFSPIFFANLVFSREFRDTETASRAFGWNMLGAVAGGGFEYFSLLLGNRNLILLVAVFYLITAFVLKKQATSAISD